MQPFNEKKQLLWMLLGAILTAIPSVFPSTGIVQWITMIPLLIGVYRLGEAPSIKLGKMYRYGFFTVFAYYFVIYHWFVNLYPLDFVGLDHTASLVVVVAGWLGLSLLQAISGGLIFLIYQFLCRLKAFERTPWLRPFAFASLWAIFEWSATLTWTGVPWGRLCLGQISNLPMLQSASLLGSYFVSFLIVLINGLLAYAILYRMRATVCGVSALALLLVNFSFGFVRMRLPEKAEKASIKVAIIQGNISSHEKWDNNSLEITKDTHAELTRQAALEGAELVLWAETVLPYVLNERRDLQRFVSDLAEECKINLIVGALYRDDDENLYNALFQVDPNGTISQKYYAKRHLVPFGEYVPMKELLNTLIPPLAELSALDADLTQGTETALFEVDGIHIGSLICFDSIYESLNRDSVVDGAEFMLLSTNDSWFRDSAAVYMHQSQARLRAIESGRYVVRSANTGISSVISDRGVLLTQISPLEKGYSVQSISPLSHTTLYMAIGNLFVYLCIAFICLLIPIGIFCNRNPRASFDMASRYGKGN